MRRGVDMRIVIDDSKLLNAYDWFNDFIRNVLDVKATVRYDYGSERVQSNLFCDQLKKCFAKHNFEIGKTVTHAHGIGNNCQYPLYYVGNPEEKQQVGYININHGMYGELYTSINDYDQNLIGCAYEIRKYGIYCKDRCVKSCIKIKR